MAASVGVAAGGARLPRLLYIGDVSVADTVAGEALLYRLLQFYPPDRLAVICGVRPDMPRLPGVAYHHWGAGYPSLLHSRVAEEYVLWHAWRYYEVPPAIAHTATMFKPDAILTISHVSAWLAAWQLSLARGLPLHLIAHDDFVYASRFPRWSRAWAERKFGEAYRHAAGRLCISESMAESYRARFGAEGDVLYPTHKGTRDLSRVSPRLDRPGQTMTFAYGGSLNSAADIQQLVRLAQVITSRQHVLVAYTPQHGLLADAAARAGVRIDARPPIHSDLLLERFRQEADCLVLPQSMAPEDRAWVAAAFPTKWADYSTVGLPVLVWAPPGSSSDRFLAAHPGCAALVTGTDAAELEGAIAALEADADYRRRLADTLLRAARTVFSPQAAWQHFCRTLTGSQEAA